MPIMAQETGQSAATAQGQVAQRATVSNGSIRPSLGLEGAKYARRHGVWLHALAGFGWGVTAPLLWILLFLGAVMWFFDVVGITPNPEESFLDLRSEMVTDLEATGHMVPYLWTSGLVCVAAVALSFIWGLIVFRRWGGKALWVTVLSGVSTHIAVFPFAIGAGTLMLMLTSMSLGWPTNDPFPLTPLLVVTAIIAVTTALVNGAVGMLFTWLFAHAFRPKESPDVS